MGPGNSATRYHRKGRIEVAFKKPRTYHRNSLGRPVGYLNIFPNGFNRGPYILILFKGFQGPTHLKIIKGFGGNQPKKQQALIPVVPLDASFRYRECPAHFLCEVLGVAVHHQVSTKESTRTLLVPLIGDIWSLIVGIEALIEGRRRV